MAITDDFNRADNASLGANWTDLNGDCQIVSNAVRGNNAGSYSSSYYSGSSWNADHTSQIVADASLTECGPTVRSQNVGGVDGYEAMLHSSGYRRIYRKDNGSYTLIANFDGTVAGSDTIKLTATGTTLEYFRNGASLGTVTDATYSAGAPGIYVFGDLTVTGLDNWEGTGESGAAFDPATGFGYVTQTPMYRAKTEVVAY